MPRWTVEQQEAIDKDKSNIIVSAGAGSGKTAVLTARVIRKLEQGVNINELLILTFTNAAAAEMKERIRNAVKKNKDLSDQLPLIDGAYITTFDSFSLSLVKKYHYLLGIDKNINIVDASVMFYEKSLIVDKIFEELYSKSDKNFLKLIGDFCVKDDKDIKKHVLNINNKLDLLYDKRDYLYNYLNEFYDESLIQENINEFNKLILEKIKLVKDLLNDLSYHVDDDYHSKIYTSLNNLLKSNNYDEVASSLNIKLPMLPKGSNDDAKDIKEQISTILKELKSFCIYESTYELKDSIFETKDYAYEIIDIIKRLDNELDCFKMKNNMYEFNDISKMAINVLINNEDVRLSLKNSLNEIMVDEYQDTSDLQEKFISLIENNNVYMVGDIKQSIYRFRNANPYIFKNKYDNYSKNENGYKIDLNKNFRSREETLNDINVIFDFAMDDYIGGADYVKSHRMIFGNTLYTENDVDEQNNHLEIYNYAYDKDNFYTKEEIECFTVAWDIKNKVNSKYQVFDKEISKLRDITYNDFVILMDRAVKFDLYKKIFEYLNIPLTKYTDTSITDSNDILLLKNIVGLVIKFYKKEIDIEFKYFYMSVARSYLFRLSDDEIFSDLDSNLLDNKIVQIIKDICRDYDNLSISELIDTIIDKFDFYENLIKVGNIQASIIRLEYMYNLAINCEELGYDIEEFFNYLLKIIDEEFDINVSMSENSTNSVKIMTIHKSKGLEYPICYYTGLYASFNIMDMKERFLFDNKYGIIVPYFKEGIAKTFYNILFRENYMKEEISEKIRLFYVGLTRCREKMIVVAPIQDKTMNDFSKKLGYRSFLDILNSVYDRISSFVKDIPIEDINITKDYVLSKKVNYKGLLKSTSKKIEKITLNFDNKEVLSNKFSKNSDLLTTKEIRNKLKLGTEIHKIFEMYDFNKNTLNDIDVKYRKYLDKFLNCGINFSNGIMYKEHEFVYNDDNGNICHGIIDMMIEYPNSVSIIDYKLKNIDDKEYITQLMGYKDYIKTKTKKPVNIYLYSIVDGELKELKG